MKTLHILLLPLAIAGCVSPFNQSHTKAYPKNHPIQQIAYEAVETAKASLHPRGIAVIVAEPKTGKILAISGNETGSIFEPGSTFKPVVAVAALQEGKITPKTKIFCENGAFNFKGKTIKDHNGSGELSFDEILMRSSNIGSAKMSLLLKDSVYYDYVCRFGFGQKTEISEPGEKPGIVNPPSKYDGFTKVRNSFGQSVGVTPIQLTMAYCALANGGLLMKPRIGDERPVVIRRVCSKGNADRVKNALEKTVSDQGTAPLARVDGMTVGGKTGTVQAINPHGGYYKDKYWTMFAGFFPVDHPRYVVVVVVDQADLPPEKNYGGLVAAPIFSEIAGKISKLK